MTKSMVSNTYVYISICVDMTLICIGDVCMPGTILNTRAQQRHNGEVKEAGCENEPWQPLNRLGGRV